MAVAAVVAWGVAVYVHAVWQKQLTTKKVATGASMSALLIVLSGVLRCLLFWVREGYPATPMSRALVETVMMWVQLRTHSVALLVACDGMWPRAFIHALASGCASKASFSLPFLRLLPLDNVLC